MIYKHKTQEEIFLLKKLRKLNGRYYCTHNSRYDSRRQTVVWIIIDNKCYLGQAQCSLKDEWSKKIGRGLALKRAFERYEQKDNIKIPDFITYGEQNGIKPCKHYHEGLCEHFSDDECECPSDAEKCNFDIQTGYLCEAFVGVEKRK